MISDDQIKEVMRRYGICAGSSSEWSVHEVGAGRKSLEAYLRTIGEPENTFPLNPNGASKWAHLQKHDGAEAIGVVFRTGSGSVGSLVDGRVVWADWLAHPNGSKPADSEYTDEDMAAVGRALMSAIAQYAPKGWSPADCPSELVGDLHNECEELRSDAERYRKLRDEDAWGEDTAPDGGSAWALLGELHGSEFDAFVDSRAESAIETPAKVSPCAGHAVQLPDPLGLLSCTHPDCGRYEGPRSHECRAMADNACARPSICQGHAAQQDADALLARIARAIWGLRREEEDRCDMELEDMPHDHSVWKEAKAAIEAMKGGS